MANAGIQFWILNGLVAFIVGFLAGTLAGSEHLRLKIFGRIIRRKLRRKPLISARAVCCKHYICKDGLMAIHGLSLQNRIPFVHVSDSWVELAKPLMSWVMHW